MKPSAFWTAFLVTVIAEVGCLGRNSALFASQQALAAVVLGTLLGNLVILLISLLVGELLYRLLPERWIVPLAGLVFILMGSLMLFHHP